MEECTKFRAQPLLTKSRTKMGRNRFLRKANSIITMLSVANQLIKWIIQKYVIYISAQLLVGCGGWAGSLWARTCFTLDYHRGLAGIYVTSFSNTSYCINCE